MSLRKQLNEIFPNILPANPKDSIKGTELIRLVRMRLEGHYSDASLRYHFSVMSCDPASFIAKVEKGQGYYRRTAPVPALAGAQELISMTQGRLDDLTNTGPEAIDSALMRVKKFRAVVQSWCELNGRYPFAYREPFQENAPLENLWKFPEMALVDWQGALVGEDNSPLFQLKSQLGIPPFRLSTLRLRILPTHRSFREDFFQALSASSWSQGGELFYASAIEDEALAESFRKLNALYGIGITTFGLSADGLDELPRPANILNAHPRETEALMERLDITKVAAPKFRSHIDWEGLNSIRSDSGEMNDLLEWLENSIKQGYPTTRPV